MTVHPEILAIIKSPDLNLYLESCGLTLMELQSILAQAEILEAELQRVYTEADQVLEGQSHIVGFAGPEFATLSDYTTHDFWLTSSFRLGHEFPIRTWQKILTKQKNHIERVKWQIESCKRSRYYAAAPRNFIHVRLMTDGEITIKAHNQTINLRMSQGQARQMIAAIQAQLR